MDETVAVTQAAGARGTPGAAPRRSPGTFSLEIRHFRGCFGRRAFPPVPELMGPVSSPHERTRIGRSSWTTSGLLDYDLVGAAAAKKRGSLDEGMRLVGMPIEPHSP
jgi:hypothetical protein